MSNTFRKNVSTSDKDKAQKHEILSKNTNTSTSIQYPKMGEPGFENLTEAEKLNDDNYRQLIFNRYPNEPICKCNEPYQEKTFKISTCPGGCTSNCCSSLLTKAKKKRCRKNNFYSFLKSRRMRGGGEDLENVMTSLVNSNIDHARSDNHKISNMKFNVFNERSKYRLEGGGGEINNEQCEINPCKESLEGFKKHEDNRRIIKEPCFDAECFKKVYEDAAAFVNSIGTVPGLTGFNLMDTSKSSCFGREKRKKGSMKNLRSNNHQSHSVFMDSRNSSCRGPCNARPVNFGASRMAGRLGVIREAFPILPDPHGLVVPGSKVKKKDEEVEKQKEGEPNSTIPEKTGPCGESRCKSRRRKNNTDSEDIDSKGSLRSKDKHSKNEDKFDKSKGKGSFEERHRSRSAIKMARRIAKFVYSAGDIYPGLNFGHKHCVSPIVKVPPNMGYLWRPELPAGKLRPRVGWKPGAINTNLRRILQEAKESFWHSGRTKSASSKNRRNISTRGKRSYSSVRGASIKKQEVSEAEWKEPPPTLHIQRKEGVYYVTMYPIKQDTMDIPKLEIPTKPLQFKITRDRDDNSEDSSSTVSDMEIQFSPPAAVNRYRKKPDVIHVQTQVKQQEIQDTFKTTGEKKSEGKSSKTKKAKK